MSGKYRCVFADPPWRYDNKGGRAQPKYETLTVEEICKLGALVECFAADNSHLWLCVTNSFLIEGVHNVVAGAWGFNPKQILTWCKARFGFGNWLRNSTEHVVLCVRGRLPPLNRNVPTHIITPNTAHSVKPQALFNAISSVSPGPRIELFARTQRDGWDNWGLEAPSGVWKPNN